MSLILDALNKADRERSENAQAPSIHEPVPTPAPSPDGIVIKIKWVVIGVFGLSMILAAVYFIGRSSLPSSQITSSPTNISENSEQNSQIKPLEQNSGVNHIQTNVVTPAQDKPKSYAEFQEKLKEKQIAEQYKRAQETKEIEKALTSNTQQAAQTINDSVAGNELANNQQITHAHFKASNAEENTDIKPSVDDLYKAESKASSQQQNTVTAKNKESAVNNKTSSEQTTTDDRLEAYTWLGTIRDLPWTMQDNIPSLTYSAHNYQLNGGSVVINQKTYRNGAKISDKLYIEKILKDGVILKYEEFSFKVRALSSWVNI